jgi:hypothetical protein
MTDHSRRILEKLFEKLFRLLMLVGHGRGAVCAPSGQSDGTRAVRQWRCAAPVASVSPGEDGGYVQPYSGVPQGHRKRHVQRTRRRALWLAVHGIDVGPRVIHGVRVAGS